MPSHRASSSTRVASLIALTLFAVVLAPTVVAQDVDTGIDGTSPFGDLVGDLTLGDPIVVGVVIAVVALVVGLLFLGGTKFITPDNVLENDSRRQIFEFIQENPGTHLRATAQALDLSTTNVLWHLRKLEDAELVSHKKFEGYKLFYPKEGGVETKRAAIAAAVLRNDNARGILEYVLANPGAHQREIARALDVNHGTVRWHLRKLTEADLLEQVKKEYTTQYFISQLGNQALADDLGQFPEPEPEGAAA